MRRRSAPASSRCVAKQCRRVWGCTFFFRPARRSGLLAGIPDDLAVDRRIGVVVVGKQPDSWLSLQAAPVLAQSFEEFRAEHDIPVSAPLAALDVNDHALAVNVADFESGQLGTPHPGGIEGHQQNALVGRASGIDESRNFFWAENRGEAMALFRIGSFLNVPGLFERLDVEKPQGRQTGCHRAR